MQSTAAISSPERAVCKESGVSLDSLQDSLQDSLEDCTEEQLTDFIGNGQRWAKVIACIILLGSILFLALPSMQDTPKLFTIVLKIWYALAIPMSIFGYVSIAGHHPSSINLYCFYFGFNALLSLGLSTVAIVISIENHMQDKPEKCETKMCMSQYSDLIIAGINGLQILFWLFAIVAMRRFYVRHRKQYLQWKTGYRQDCHQSHYHHWAFKHQINRSNSSASTNPLV